VIHKIKGEASVDFEKMFPAKQPSKVTIRTTDGRQFSQYLEYPKGDPREPMTEEDLKVKFNALSAAVLTPVQQEQIRQATLNFESYDNIADFFRLLKAL